MATISENLLQLNETKQALKTAIENKGQDLTDVPFTEYAEKIDAISVGSESNPVPLTVTENGVYENEQGFSPVTVEIKNKIPTDTTATAGDITEGKTAYVNGEKVVGTNTDAEFIRVFTTRTNMGDMFRTCSELTSVPNIDTSNVTDMNNMFQSCSKLVTVPKMDTSKVTNMTGMFSVCEQLTSVPDMDTSNVTAMGSMFYHCSQLAVAPKFTDTSKCTNMSYMFQTALVITEISDIDMRNVTNASSMFGNCKQLTSCFVRNIKTNLQVGSGTSWGHLLTVESLIHLIYELRDTGSLKTLTMGNVNLNKLANMYVRLIEITDEMRAEDDLIDEKLPFEVCESTDEGAMWIVDYVSLKNWELR